MADNSCVIGIDLGTTYCCAAYYRPSENRVEIIKNEFGEKTTPSYVFFDDTQTTVGKFAKRKVHLIRENVVFDSKRLIGQNFGSKAVQRNLQTWPFIVERGVDNKPLIKILTSGTKIAYEPEKISAKLLEYMKRAAEDQLDMKDQIKDVVITVPAYFNYHQRTATQEAGKLAGLNVLRIINEPTAAALTYVHQNNIVGHKNLLVFDLGGGTFDVSIVTVEDDKYITVRATSGDTYLGGRDFDENLTNFIAEELEKKYYVPVKKNDITMRRIRARSEETKIELSQALKMQYDIIGLVPLKMDLEFEIKRQDFERINNDLFEKCITIVKDCLSDARMAAAVIDKVILCGGSSRIPKLQKMLKDLFGEEKLCKGVDPDEAVAYGAAIQASRLQKGDAEEVKIPTITDITPLSLGTSVVGGRMSFVLRRNSPIPVNKTAKFHTSYDKQSSVSFDIYEGERKLVEHNTKIGGCVLKNLPPRPLGYAIVVTFHINDNGVLEVGATTSGGIYTSLAIKYEKQNTEAITDILREAKLNESADEKVYKVIEKWASLNQYQKRVMAVCTYDEHDTMEAEDKNTIKDIVKSTSTWLKLNEVKNGSEEEENAITCKQDEMEKICESILDKYGYKIRDMLMSDFYEFLIKLQKNELGKTKPNIIRVGKKVMF